MTSPLDQTTVPLSDDLLYEICVNYLAYFDVIRLCRSCRSLYDLIYRDESAKIWRALYRRDISKLRVPETIEATTQGKILSEFSQLLSRTRFVEAVRRGYEILAKACFLHMNQIGQIRAIPEALSQVIPHGYSDLFEWLVSLKSSSDLSRAVICAAQSNRYDYLERLVQIQVRSRSQNQEELSPDMLPKMNNLMTWDIFDLEYALVGAARGGHDKLFHDLLKSERQISLSVAIRAAAEGNQTKLLEELLSLGNETDAAINGAARGGHRDLVVSFLDRGANIDSAMIGAAVGGHLDLIRYLKSRNQRINYPGIMINAAAYHGHLDVINYFLTEDSKQHDLNKALDFASEHGHLHVVKRLLQAGAKINADTLRWSEYEGYSEIAKYLKDWTEDHPESLS